jgi:hypothetical protein
MQVRQGASEGILGGQHLLHCGSGPSKRNNTWVHNHLPRTLSLVICTRVTVKLAFADVQCFYMCDEHFACCCTKELSIDSRPSDSVTQLTNKIPTPGPIAQYCDKLSNSIAYKNC